MLDSNNFGKLISHKNASVAPSAHSIMDDRIKSNTYLSETGEIVIRKLKKTPTYLSSSQVLQIISEYQSGKTTYQLAEKFSCSRDVISRHLKKHGIRVTITKSKIADNIPAIVMLYASGMKISQIAKQYEVCESTIQKYLHIGGAKLRSRWEYPDNK